MALSPQDRTLRHLTILSWIPGMALLIPYGVRTATIFPALGLVPLTMSAVLGLAKVCGYIKADYHMYAVTIYTVSVDALITFLLLAFTIPGFSDLWRWQEMGTFAMFPLFLNMCIHIFFVAKDSSFLANFEEFFKPRVCQYCKRDLQTMWDAKRDAAKVDTVVSPPTLQVTGIPTSAPPEYVEPSTSAFTTPRPSTDFDAVTLDGSEGSIRSSHTVIKARDSGDIV